MAATATNPTQPAHVTEQPRVNAITHRNHPAHDLMPRHERIRTQPPGVVDHREIAVAKTAMQHLEDHLTCCWLLNSPGAALQRSS